MCSLRVLIRWRDVVVGAVVWALFAAEFALLGRAFPATPPGCVASTMFECWDLRAPILALASVPFWYAAWARLLRPCPWQLRWLTPFAVSYAAYRVAGLGGSDWAWQVRLAVLVAGYFVAATAMSALNGRAQATRESRS